MKEVYKTDIYFTMLDRIISEFINRLLDHSELFESLDSLDYTSEIFLVWSKLEKIALQYKSHFTIMDIVNLKNQASTAKNMFVTQKDLKIDSIQDAAKELCVLKSAFDQLLKLIFISLTLPVSTASNERFFSTLKRVKTFVRSLIGDERLSNLVLIAAENKFIRGVDKEKLVDKFGKLRQRRYPCSTGIRPSVLS